MFSPDKSGVFSYDTWKKENKNYLHMWEKWENVRNE